MSEIDDFLEMEKDRDLLQDPMLTEAQDALGETGIPDIEAITEYDDFNESEKLQGELANERISRIIEDAQSEKPENATKILKMARESGLPVDFVAMDPDGMERALKTQKTLDLLETSPILKESAEDLAQYADEEDFENLSVFERLHRDASAGLDTGMANREIGLARRKLMGEAFGEVFGEELTEPEKQELRNRIKELQTQLQQPSGGSGGFIESAANAIGSFIEGVPQVIAAGVIGGTSAAAVSAPTGLAAPGIILGNAAIFSALELYRQSSGVEGGHVAQELINAGVEKDIANNVGEASGNLAGLLEVTGAKIIASPFKDMIKNRFKENVKRTILKQTAKKSALVAGAKTFGKTMAGETATEVGQELISIAGVETGKSLSDKEFKSITASEIQHQVGEIFKETLKAMTILAIPGASISIYNQKKSADQAVANQEYLRSMGENVQASKLKQRDGETHKEFSKRVHEGTSVDSVYIEAEKLQEVYQDDTGLLVEEIGAADQFEDAMARGGDIVIPLSVYTDKIAGDIDAHNKIMPHAKFDAEGLTAFRAEEMVKDEAEFRQKADRILKEQAGNTEFISSAEEVFQGVREQLVATGRFNDETVDNYAALHQAFSVVKAKQLGKTPAEVYEMFGLKVQKGEQTLDQQVQAERELIKQESEAKEATRAERDKLNEMDDSGASSEEMEAQGEKVDIAQKKQKAITKNIADSILARRSGEQVSAQQTLGQQALAVKRTPEFQSFFEGSQVVDEAGEPLVVYRGEHGAADQDIQTRRGSISFGSKEAANIYSTTPNDRTIDKTSTSPRVIPAYVSIKNPVINDPGDPFIDMSRIYEILGKEEGDRIAKKYTSFIEETDTFKTSFGSNPTVRNVLEKYPDRAGEMFFPAYVLFDDAKEVAKFKEKGFDGAIHGGSGETALEAEYKVFDQSQIKSIYNERPTDSPDILSQEVRSRGLYSAVEQAFQDMKIPAWKKENGEANGKDVWAKLKTMPGIKQEEIKWLGVEEFLTGNPKAKFTRQEVISFAEQNGVTVETVVADQEQDENFDGIQWTEQRVWDDPEAWQNEIEDAEHNGIKEDAIVDVRSLNKHNIPKEIEGLDAKNEWIEENYESEIDDQVEAIAQARYMDNPVYIVESDEGVDLSLFGNDDLGWSVRRGGWQQHENTVIDEPTYSLGEAQIQAENYARENDLIRDEGDETATKWSEYVMPGYMENYRELKLTLPDIGNEFYEEAHFPDPNIVAFLRVNDRELGANPLYTQAIGPGEKKLNTYFIDEFQSDWHQQGRQKGYSTGGDAGVIEEQAQGRGDKLDSTIEDIFNEAYKKDADPAEEDAIRINREDDGGYIIRKREFTQRAYEVIRNDGKPVKFDSGDDPTGIKGIRYEYIAQAIADSGIDVAAMKEETAAVASMEAQVNAERYGVPDAPFKGDSWMALGLKQAILDAVDNGYEAIAWADADVLSNRWSERYEKLYRMQYDKKMPSIAKRLTGIVYPYRQENF